MAWTDKLRAASFRGVAFKVEDHDMQAGRRTVTHEFPLRDKPFVEDMGRRAKQFAVSAYVVGEDYMTARDALLRACDEAGSGELVHPYLGTLKVVCTGCTLRESKAEGRMARFTLQFIETGEAEFPSDAADPLSLTSAASDAAKVATIDDFEDVFSVDGLPDFAATDAISIAQDAAESVLDAVSSMNDMVSGELGFVGQVNDFIDDVSGLVQTPRQFAESVFDMIEGVTGIATSPMQAIQSLFKLFDFGDDYDAINQTTATRRRQQANRTAMFALMQRAAAVESARNAPAADYETTQDAETVRDTLADKLDAFMEDDNTSDDVFQAMQSLRTEVVRGVPPESASLPNLATVTPQVTAPALVLAYDLYEDATRESEIVARNSIRHPGFVPGAQPLQVIADA